jgi:hypothetical protein
MTGFNGRALDTADNPPLASGGLSRTQKTGGPVFSGLVAEYRYDIHEIWEITEAIEDYYA